MIDVSVLVGAAPRLQPAAGYGVEAATDALTAHRISTALIAHRAGANLAARAGNDALLAACVDVSSGGVELLPVGTLNPRHYLDWPAELDRALNAGVVAMRFFPDIQEWPVTSQAFGEMLDGLRGKCPVLVPVTTFGSASAIGVATERLEMPVVLIGAHYTQLADCLAALRRWPRLHLETSRLGQFRGVETVVAEVGASRLLFGSGAPQRPIQAPLNAVLTADISEDDKRAILGGNARRVFGLTGAPPIDLPRPVRGEGLIDIHGHVGSLGYAVRDVDVPAQLEMLRCHGITQTVASSLRAIVDDADQGNREAITAAAASGGRLAAYVVVNPNDLDGSCQSLDDAYPHDRAVGAKLHSSWAGQPTASSATVALLREIARRKRPLKIHIDGADWVDALATVANDYPDWKVILAHAGPGMPSREAACLVSQTRNVYVELSTTFPDLPVIKDVVARVGPGRLLFGTDAPLIDPSYVLGIYADAGADLSATAALAHEVFEL